MPADPRPRRRGRGLRGPTRFVRLEDDPLALLVNFFDCAIVFAIGLILMISTADRERSPAGDERDQGRPVPAEVERPRFELGQGSAKGEGTRLGVAYRLASGEVVYVPDGGDGPEEGKEGQGAGRTR
ncbi:MAG: DUF2149 domain-containing protein [Planctomycetota bacterium]